MFDFHIHSRVSFDGHDTGRSMAEAGLARGLTEICFTDHLDYDPLETMGDLTFRTEDYNREYDNLSIPGLTIRRGIEFGMTSDNRVQLQKDLQRRPFDFVLGSIHFVDNYDVYFEDYWAGKTIFQAEHRFLEATLECIHHHDDFDVLAHLTYLGKTKAHPSPRPIRYNDHRDLLDEILRTLAQKGKGLEINTSGVDRCGDYLPGAEYLQRFHDLGGKIVTVGSDSHTANRVGQYSMEACRMAQDIFGHVCTFANREPIFHR